MHSCNELAGLRAHVLARHVPTVVDVAQLRATIMAGGRERSALERALNTDAITGKERWALSPRVPEEVSA
jgi:hypothetical protein